MPHAGQADLPAGGRGAAHGEEEGAELMLAEGAFDDPTPEAVFGLHAFADMEVGKVGYTVGPAFAAVDHFRRHRAHL